MEINNIKILVQTDKAYLLKWYDNTLGYVKGWIPKSLITIEYNNAYLNKNIYNKINKIKTK